MSRIIHMILVGLMALAGIGLAWIVTPPQAAAVTPSPPCLVTWEPPDQLPWALGQNPADLDWRITFQHLATWGQKGSSPGQFDGLYDIVMDPASGLLYVTEKNNDRVQILNENGWYTGSWGTHGAAAGQLDGPTGLAISQDKRIYVLDRGNDRVQVFGTGGDRLAAWQLQRPRDITLSADGNIFVLHEPNIPQVSVHSPAGVRLDQFVLWDNRGVLVEASHLVASPGGLLYTVDSSQTRIVVFSLTGEYQFEWPLASGPVTGVGLSPDGLLYTSALHGETSVHTLQGIRLGALLVGGATGILATEGNPSTIYLAVEDRISIYRQIVESWNRWAYLPLVVRPYEDPDTPTPPISPDPTTTVRPSATRTPTETPSPMVTPGPSSTATIPDWRTPTHTQSPSVPATPTTWSDSYEPNDSFDDAWGPLLPDQLYQSFIWSRTDEDLYYFDARSAGLLSVILASPPPDTDYDLYLYDGARNMVAKSERVGSAEYIPFAQARAGRYFIHIRSYDGRSSRRYPYRLQISFGAVTATPSPTNISPYPAPPTETNRPPTKTPPATPPKGTATRTRTETTANRPSRTPTPRR